MTVSDLIPEFQACTLNNCSPNMLLSLPRDLFQMIAGRAYSMFCAVRATSRGCYAHLPFDALRYSDFFQEARRGDIKSVRQFCRLVTQATRYGKMQKIQWIFQHFLNNAVAHAKDQLWHYFLQDNAWKEYPHLLAAACAMLQVLTFAQEHHKQNLSLICAAIHACTNLTSLSISGLYLDDDQQMLLDSIKERTALAQLNLRRVENLDFSLFKDFNRFSHLQKLSLTLAMNDQIPPTLPRSIRHLALFGENTLCVPHIAIDELETLELSQFHFTSTALYALATFSQLRSLTLKGPMERCYVGELARLRKLRELVIETSIELVSHLEKIASACTELQNIEVATGEKISANQLANIVKVLPHLKRLCIRDLLEGTKEACKTLARTIRSRSQLEHLSLSFSSSVTKALCKGILSVEKLSYLQMSAPNFLPLAQTITQNTSLRTLSLSSRTSCFELTKALVQFTNLCSLKLALPLTDAEAQEITRYNHLESFFYDASYHEAMPLTCIALKAIASAPRLQACHFRGKLGFTLPGIMYTLEKATHIRAFSYCSPGSSSRFLQAKVRLDKLKHLHSLVIGHDLLNKI